MPFRIQNSIPNALTLLNLFSGCLAIVFAFMGRLDLVPNCVAVSLLADFFDGFIARKIDFSSPIGPDLDSLADMVSFGALPGVILFLLIDRDMGGMMMIDQKINITALCGFMLTLFSALRLAKFNIDESDTKDFIGLATPAATVFVVGILLLERKFEFDLRPANYLIITGVLSVLLVSNIKMFSFKISSLGWKDSSWQYAFIALSLPALIWLKFASLSLIIIIYIFLNVIKHLVDRRNNNA
ncbi:MAG: CDP-alcohol phosphatidyltransferase family protein [Chitinophagales bacterium]